MKTFRISILLSILVATLVFGSCKPKETDEQKINAIIGKMTLDEKLDFIGGINRFYVRGYPHLGIPEIRFADGPVGVRNYGKSTAFPASITLAASFDKELAYKVGKAIGSEARAKNVQVMLGPAMNIYRAPFCGRNFEYLGEDPYLAGQIAVNYTKGMQAEGVMATAKHFAANNQDYNRHFVSSDMDERTLHEIYLPAFKAVVQQGDVASVMTSYNLINGVHASQNDYLISKTLKEEWGFKGFVMSDWTSTYDGIACARAGLDLEMPWAKFMNPDTLRPAIVSGELDIKIIDDKIRRILREYFRFGLMQHPDISKNYILDSVSNRSLAIEEARGGIVLLKNAGDFLPLNKSSVKSIAIIGPNGDPAVTGGGGSAYVPALHPLSMLEAFRQIAGTSVEVTFEPGVYPGDRLPEGFFKDFNLYFYENGQKKKGAKADFYGNTKLEGNIVHSTVFGKINLENEAMKLDGVPEKDFSVRFSGIFSPSENGNYTFGCAGDDGYRLYIDGKQVIEQWQTQGETIRKYQCNLKAGRDYKIVLEYFQGRGDAVIRFSVNKSLEKEIGKKEYLARAIELAKKSDIVVMCVGFTNKTEGEGSDRTFEMPFNQSELINQIAAVNSNVVVVLNSGGNVAMTDWLGNIKGLIHSWYPGQEGSLAVAEIVFGITNPSGKLPVSFERKWEDNPTFNSYFDDDNDLKVFYSEGIFLGYRYYDKAEVKPLFPFGYGLSYTSFEYSNAWENKTEFTADEILKVKVDVKNTGKYDGAESVQLYVLDKESSLPRPIKELKDFGKVFLKVGETKTLEFNLNKDAFSYYVPGKKQWVAEPGEFSILLGSSSVDIRQELKVVLKE